MPDKQVLMYFKETGEPTLMFSVDAFEASRLGDYVFEPPSGHEVSPEQRAAAYAQARAGLAPKPPELMTPEEREAARAEANQAEVARLEKLQLPIPLVLQHAVGVGTPRTARQAKADAKDAEPPKAATAPKADAKDEDKAEPHATMSRSSR